MARANKPKGRPRAAVIVNPAKIDRSRLNAIVERAAGAAGWGSTLWLQTSQEDPGRQLARYAVAAGVSVVMVAGGDGTVRAVAEGLLDSGVPMALIPSGTGNVLARNLQLKLADVSSAVALAFDGQDQPVDVGWAEIERAGGAVESHAFLVMAGIGLDAEIMASTSSRGKRIFGWLAYVSGAMRALNRSQRARSEIRVGDRIMRAKAHTVLLCNCGVLPGNLLLVPDASIHDGQLDVLAISPRRLVDWIPIWQRVVVEHQLRRSKVGERVVQLGGERRLTTLLHAAGAELGVRVERPRPCELDGDLFGEAVALRAAARPGGLLVRVPAA